MTTVALIGSLDTKGREYAYVRDQLAALGVESMVIDFSILRDPPWTPDVSADEVARAGGSDLATLRSAGEDEAERSRSISVMELGATRILLEMWRAGRCQAVLGFGGGQGSTVISGAMRALPVGVPKLLVSTMSPSNVGLYFGTRDICLMYAVTDIAGLNRLSRRILANAARAAAGMAARTEEPAGEAPLVALTMFGTTTTGVLQVQSRLEAAGFETVVFHAVGSGGAAMEELITEGTIDAVIDFTPSEIADEVYGGIFSAGPDRMSAAAARGIPQVVVPGALAQLTFGPLVTVPPGLLSEPRRWLSHNPSVTVVRANVAECQTLGRVLADKINAAPSGTVAVALPLGGLSDYETPPGPLADPEADAALFRALRDELNPSIPIYERPEHVNEEAFTDFVAQAFLDVWSTRAQHAPPLQQMGLENANT